MDNCFIEKASMSVPSAMPVQHCHPYYELYMLVEGNRKIFIENDEYTMAKNDLLLIPSNILHRTDGNTYTRFLVNFNENYSDEEQKDVIELFQRQKLSATPEEAKNIFSIINAMYELQEDNSKEIKNKEYDIKTLFRFLMFFISKTKNFPKTKYSSKNIYSTRTKAVIDYINKHYQETITLDLLSKNFFVAKSVLCNEFKKNTHTSIIDYLLRVRLKKAQDLLMYSDESINRISVLCGFSSQCYFYLIFKKHIKASPSEYRKKHKISFSPPPQNVNKY